MSEQALHPLLEQVKKLQLPLGDYAIFGSGPMLVRGLIEAVNDIDVICRDAAWQAAQAAGELVYLDAYDVNVVSIDDGLITIGTSWGIGNFDVEELIDTAEIICDLPFVQLQHVVTYKQIAQRPNDLLHLELLQQG